MPQPKQPPVDQPLTAALPTLDKYWCIQEAYATNARRELDRHDLAAHTANFQAGQSGTDKFLAGYYDDDEDDAGSDAPQKPYTVTEGGVAVLYLSGPITKRPTSMSYFFGGTSSVLLRRAVRQAAADPDVKAIALIVDSPGGQVNGTADLAADVAAAAQKKPVGAYAEDTCCSAAYWVASQADFLYCNLTGAVGSIGTLLVIQDTSGAYAKEGVKVNVISTGPYKGAGADGAPVTKAHLEDFQREVDDINACFLQSVADGRKNLTLEDVTALATGQVHIGQKAVDLGLCDAVTSLDEFMESMAMQAEAFAQSSNAPAAAPDLPPGQDDGDDSGPDASTPTSADALAPTLADASAETPADILVETTAGNDLPAELPETTASTLPNLNTNLQENDTMADDLLVPPAAAAAPASTQTLPSAPAAPGLPSAQAATHKDILAACHAAGITSAKQLTDRLAMATLGDAYSEETRDDAKVQAIRAYGAEVGQQCAASCEHLPVATVASMRDGWKAQADKAFGIGQDGEAPTRKTAPAAQKSAVPAEAGADQAEGAAKWDKLTVAQRSQGEAMGMKTPEQREKFAANVLGTTEGKGE